MSIWVNEDEETGGLKFNIVASKSYFDEEKKEWVPLKSFSDRDMTELAHLSQRARNWCDDVRIEEQEQSD